MIKIKRLLKSFVYAFRGLFKVFREEQNLKIQAVASIIVIAAAWLLNISRFEWIIIVLIICLVLLMEIMNSAIELITDVLKPRLDSYVKEIKDIAAAAVILSSIAAAVVGLIIFWPYLFG